jgi:hypothetical protein
MTDNSKEEWIPWNGGACPVRHQSVLIKRRNGYCSCLPWPAVFYKWGHTKSGEDIIGFKIDKEDCFISQHKGVTRYTDDIGDWIKFPNGNKRRVR